MDEGKQREGKPPRLNEIVTSTQPLTVEVTGIAMPYVRSLLGGDTSVLPGTEIPGPAGVTVYYRGATEYRGLDVPPVHEFVMAVSAAIPARTLVEWLRSRFRGHAQKVTINRREIDLDDEGQVRRVIEEEISIHRS